MKGLVVFLLSVSMESDSPLLLSEAVVFLSVSMESDSPLLLSEAVVVFVSVSMESDSPLSISEAVGRLVRVNGIRQSFRVAGPWVFYFFYFSLNGRLCLPSSASDNRRELCLLPRTVPARRGECYTRPFLNKHKAKSLFFLLRFYIGVGFTTALETVNMKRKHMHLVFNVLALFSDQRVFECLISGNRF